MSMIETVCARCPQCNRDETTPVASCRDFEYETCDNEFTFVCCSDCQVIYLRNRPSPEALSTIYPRHYLPYGFQERRRSIVGRLRSRVLRGKIKVLRRYAPSDSVILDVGCGSGELLRSLREHGDPQWQLVGIDFAETAVQAVEGLQIPCEKTRFEELNWSGPRPQAIILNQVIEHLANPRKAVAKAFDLLAPNGILLVETPSFDAWDARWFGKRHWGGWHAPRHWVVFNERSLKTLLEDEGFRLVETTYLFSPNFWLTSLHHYFLDRWSSRRIASLFDVEVLPCLGLAVGMDIIQLGLHGKTSNLRMVAQKPNGSGATLPGECSIGQST